MAATWTCCTGMPGRCSQARYTVLLLRCRLELAMQAAATQQVLQEHGTQAETGAEGVVRAALTACCSLPCHKLSHVSPHVGAVS